ncbi:protein Niban 2-like [Thalassophryne amazonica]|uniref:protein Niban 2-like n=1 Tax=Thalassophryne amazonica TaxID=390379 RepID=UPI001471A194|nr:protein Niban 2-like [Thalassophryne amazonica]
MMCGAPPQILTNLVMETLHPELRNLIGPRLRGKLQDRQRSWMLISDAVYRQVLSQAANQYEALTGACEAKKVQLDAALRTDMDQIITSKEHVTGKIQALVLPKAEQLLQTSIQPYINSILEALMEPTSRGFAEVRDVFFKELVEMSKNSLNDTGKEKVGEHMDRLSMLAFHPVKMQSCYEKVEELNLEGLQQRFDVSSPSVFVNRAQILMREQMDNSVYTFEQLLNQSLESKGEEDLCKTIQRCQDRVLKKYDYDSSTVRKKFFREALLQIIIPYMLKELSLSCSSELPHFKELIFEDFSRFLLVNNMFEEVVLQSVTKDIMMAVKEAAVQRKHNLYRDSIILSNSDPNLHLLEEKPAVDWATKFGANEPEEPVEGGSVNRRKQVVSIIQLDEVPIPYESCMEVPGVELIPEEECKDIQEEDEETPLSPLGPKSPDSVGEIRGLINPVVEVVLPVTEEDESNLTNGTEVRTDTFTMDDGVQEKVTHITTVVEGVPRKSIRDKTSPQDMLRQLVGNKKQETDAQHQEEAAIKNAIEEIDAAVQEGDSEQSADFSAAESESAQSSVVKDSVFQSPTHKLLDKGEAQPVANTANGEDKTVTLEDMQVDFV